MNRRRSQAHLQMLTIGVVVLMACVRDSQSAEQSDAVDFERQVVPILARHCIDCHHGDEPAGGLDLTSFDRARVGGESGTPAIAPSRVDESYLLSRIHDGEMPPPGKASPVAESEIAILDRWIADGAVWPAGRQLSPFETTTDRRAGADWWSLQPIKRPATPETVNREWSRSPIDAFVLSALEAKQLQPTVATDRASYIRRVKFDLLGLPPTPEEVADFVADKTAGAFESLVDRLLASPHYGERWARHWLDVVRFAESQGYETNIARPNAWPYRDYVINALNRDTPFTQMILEQLAGDQLGIDAATGFLVGGSHDIVQSPEPELTAQQRLNDLDDMLTTTASTFLGMTIGCAKCHDHKFDPYTQQDYYALQAIFSGVQHGERPLRRGDDPERDRRLQERRAELANLEAEIESIAAQFEPIAQVSAVAATGADQRLEGASASPDNIDDQQTAVESPRRPPVHPQRNVDRFAPTSAKHIRFTVLATNNLEPCIDELEVYSPDKPADNIALASRGVVAAASSVYAAGASDIHRLEHLNDGRLGNSRSWISGEPGAGWVRLDLPQSTLIDRVVWARDREGKFRDRLATKYRIEVATQLDDWRTVATSDDRAGFEAGAAVPQRIDESSLPADDAARYRERTQKIEQLKTEIAALAPQMVYAGTFSEPGPTYRLYRGEPMQRREAVAPASPASIAPRMRLAADLPEGARRRAFAEWLCDARNPLPARVLANRVWQHHFGRGLMANPNDFGFHGGQPSHAELLDWLASELVDGGWRLKPLHRMIVLSSTYRQSSQDNELARAIDADAILLWRYPPRRLEAETIRDAMLAASGRLNRQMGGPGYDPFEPNDNYVKVYTPRSSFGPNEWRRMVYQNKPRMRQDAVFGEFDCPDASHSVARRNVSTTALQALNLLNGPFVFQQANEFAARLEAESSSGESSEQILARRIERAFWLAFGRAPSQDEMAAASTLARQTGLPALCRALYNSNEFIYVK